MSVAPRSQPTIDSTAVPYKRLSSFYFFYFASLGVFLPYWALYLQSQEYNAAQIGELMAVLAATKLVAPNLWGWLADHTGRHLAVIRVATVGMLFAFCGVFFADSYWSLLWVTALFSFFWNAALPQFETVTFQHLGAESQRYARVRLWGSVGFIVAVLMLGPLLDRWGASVLPGIVVLFYLLILISSFMVPVLRNQASSNTTGSFTQAVCRKPVLVLLLVCCLMQLSHGVYYTFFTIHLENHGYSRSVSGALWSLGVLAEILVFLLMPKLLRSVGAFRLMLLATAATAIRWLLIAWQVDQLAYLIIAQLLHMASFGLYHAVSIYWINAYFSGPFQGRGQGLYSSVSFGAGGALGAFISGQLWESAGPELTFVFASLVACVALLFSFFGLERAEVQGK